MADTEQPVADHTLVMLQGIRRELAAVLENQARDRELLHRLQDRVQTGFDGIASGLREVRADVAMLDMKAVSHTNEILSVMRRLDQQGLVPDAEAPSS